MLRPQLQGPALGSSALRAAPPELGAENGGSNCWRIPGFGEDRSALWRGLDRSLVQLCVGSTPKFSHGVN
eukprot:296082-Alexandrium_andersonii.AAC.1